MRKVILISSKPASNPMSGQPVHMADDTYAAAVTAVGGLPVLLADARLAGEYAQLADGLLLTGGESVHPRWFGETFERLAGGDPDRVRQLRAGCNAMRDEAEMALFQEFFRLGKPILGICRGHQLVNAALGGKNLLDFPKNHPVEHYSGIQHRVTAEADSVLGQLYGTEFLVNSYHRDCADCVGPDVRVTARSEDGLIEAIQHKTRPIFGFQFHPERMRGDAPNPAYGPCSDALFRYFLDLC